MDKTVGELIDELIVAVVNHFAIDTEIYTLELFEKYIKIDPSSILDTRLKIGNLRNQLIKEIDQKIHERKDNLNNSNL